LESRLPSARGKGGTLWKNARGLAKPNPASFHTAPQPVGRWALFARRASSAAFVGPSYQPQPGPGRCGRPAAIAPLPGPSSVPCWAQRETPTGVPATLAAGTKDLAPVNAPCPPEPGPARPCRSRRPASVSPAPAASPDMRDGEPRLRASARPVKSAAESREPLARRAGPLSRLLPGFPQAEAHKVRFIGPISDFEGEQVERSSPSPAHPTHANDIRAAPPFVLRNTKRLLDGVPSFQHRSSLEPACAAPSPAPCSPKKEKRRPRLRGRTMKTIKDPDPANGGRAGHASALLPAAGLQIWPRATAALVLRTRRGNRIAGPRCAGPSTANGSSKSVNGRSDPSVTSYSRFREGRGLGKRPARSRRSSCTAPVQDTPTGPEAPGL